MVAFWGWPPFEQDARDACWDASFGNDGLNASHSPISRAHFLLVPFRNVTEVYLQPRFSH